MRLCLFGIQIVKSAGSALDMTIANELRGRIMNFGGLSNSTERSWEIMASGFEDEYNDLQAQLNKAAVAHMAIALAPSPADDNEITNAQL